VFGSADSWQTRQQPKQKHDFMLIVMADSIYQGMQLCQRGREVAGSSASRVIWPSYDRTRRLAIEMQMRAGTCKMSAVSGVVPIRLSMAEAPRAAVEPSGRPRIARR